MDWIFSLAVTLLLKKKFYPPYLGYISTVLSPIGSNFGQRSAWLASWIAILWKNLVTYWKKRSFGRFPSLGENRNKQGDLAILLIKIAKKQGQFVATRLTLPKLGWAGKEDDIFFPTLESETQDLLWPMPPYSIFWWIGFFHSQLLWFWKRRSIGRISAILSPNWLKFWPKDGLVSLLGCYSLEKSGFLLKNGVLEPCTLTRLKYKVFITLKSTRSLLTLV